jgi:hypothetical protein
MTAGTGVRVQAQIEDRGRVCHAGERSGSEDGTRTAHVGSRRVLRPQVGQLPANEKRPRDDGASWAKGFHQPLTWS